MKNIFILVLINLIISSVAFAQAKPAVNQQVEVNWKGKWYKARILEVKGNNYKVRYDGYSSKWDETVTAARIRGLNAEKPAANTASAKPAVKTGKYGCTASKYSGGSYTYLPKGSFELKANGAYAYNGFEKASNGTFAVGSGGVITFSSGYLNGGEATPMEGSENRYYLVFPTIPDGRWTCRLLD
ncbi:agenet domain-containing protein [Aridibaculum aurantiacum]|uniref:agenet domain-containing protein n=1 Tax=Aridibaculum aurantiacum TaxID=2810307 RepID=UPI001A964A70|nr:agenet domain-containing protein [Aridibaculum aurantiacum]